MTWEELMQTINEISFRDWIFQVEYDAGFYAHPLASPKLRVEFEVPDNSTGEKKFHYGRWWKLSYHMTKGEIVQTALKAVLTALEHEAREQFLYNDRAVFSPHLDVDALHAIANQTKERSNA